MANAPGVSVTVNAPTSNPQTNSPTGTWFVVGNCHGPANIPVPINSLSDFQTYFGKIVNSSLTGRYTVSSISSNTLYDSLDVYFREGGINAYVVRPIAAAAVAATGAAGTFLNFTAASKGTWANSASGTDTSGVIITLTNITATSYTLSIAYNNQVMAVSPTLNTNTDAVNWLASQNNYQVLVSATAGVSPTVPSTSIIYLTSGTDSTAATDAEYLLALNAINDSYGPGQVSVPGITSDTTHKNLLNHAQINNRVAIMDGADTAVVATLTTAVSVVQTGGASAATDSSYGALFSPWVVVPGIASTTPSSTAPVFNRIVPPSCIVAGNIAATDVKNDCNVPAAGLINGSSAYAIGLSQTFTAADRGTLNAGQVNLLRNINGQIAIYGFRSTATDQNWVYLNNVRFRMQIVRDFDVIAENYVFAEIDGRGQIFSTLGGALAGQCQNYWLRKSIYGANAEDAFSINVGPQVNTAITIAAGQINAQVNLRMAPFGEFVNVQVTKYLVSAPLPTV